MEIEINNRVIQILTNEARDRGKSVDQLINDILSVAAMRSDYNKGQINNVEVPSGLL